MTSPPPSYSPPRPPPPYEKENEDNEKKESKGKESTIRIGPAPFVPLAATAQPISASALTVPAPTPAIVIVHSVKEAATSAPFQTFCPKCQQQVKTRQHYVVGTFTWILVIVVLFCFFPLAFVPFCLDSCKDVQHYCPRCSTTLAVKRKFF